jgi:hypothetical protein
LGFANKIEEIHEKIAEFIAKLLGRNIMYWKSDFNKSLFI